MSRQDTRLERLVESWPVILTALALVAICIAYRSGVLA